MTTFRSRRGNALSLAVAAASCLVIGVVAVRSLSPTPVKSGARSLLDLPPTNGEVAVLLGALGLDADTLAASGVTAAETTTMVANMRSHLGSHMDALRNADNTCGSARVNYDSLLRTVEAGLATEQDLSAWATAPGTLSSATASRQTLRDAAFTAATDGLAGAKVSAITTARTNHSHWDILMPYLFTNRQEAQWIALRDALSNQRIAAKHREATNPAAQAIINAADAEPATATARANLEARRTSVAAAWNQAVYPQ